MKERVLITGASGFVGYHLIEEALKHNLEVFAAVRKNSPVDHLKQFEITLTYPDFKSVKTLEKEFNNNKYHYVIHAAGLTRARDQDAFDEVNVTNTVNLANAADASHSCKKFVYISSLAALGPLPSLTGIITEKTYPQPVTAYGRSKITAEEQLQQIAGLNCTILRPTAVYGPRDTGIYLALKQYAGGFEPYIGWKPQKLSFIYVKDLAKVAVDALFSGKNRAYNLSDGNFYDRYQLADITKNILRVKTVKVHLPVGLVKFFAWLAELTGALQKKTPIVNREKLRELMAQNWHCDIEDARHDLGFYPRYNLREGLAETLKWYKTNNWL